MEVGVEVGVLFKYYKRARFDKLEWGRAFFFECA